MGNVPVTVAIMVRGEYFYLSLLRGRPGLESITHTSVFFRYERPIQPSSAIFFQTSGVTFRALFEFSYQSLGTFCGEKIPCHLLQYFLRFSKSKVHVPPYRSLVYLILGKPRPYQAMIFLCISFVPMDTVVMKCSWNILSHTPSKEPIGKS